MEEEEERNEDEDGGEEMSKEEKPLKCGKEPMSTGLENYPKRCFDFSLDSI